MTTDVLMVTYDRDVQWFHWSTATLERNLSGYRQIIAIAPLQDKHLFDPIAAQRPTLRMVYIPDWPGLGYYWQQWVKINADQYTDANFVCHVDSDAFVKMPCAIEDFFVKGRPGWMWAFYEEVGDAVIWKHPTTRASGLQCDREMMQGFPFIIHRSTYALARQTIQNVHNVSSEDYIRAAGKSLPKPGFSEFNLMGRVAWEYQKESYHFLDRNREEWPKGVHCFRQFWSHAPIADCLSEIQKMLGISGDDQLSYTPFGVWVLAHDTHISRWVEYHKRLDFDHENLRRQCAFISPGDVVVDVGAFIGDNTVAYARATAGADTGQVIAFEPNSVAHEALRRNMVACGSHVQCLNMGLSDAPGQMSFFADPNVGASHLATGNGVQVKRLDDWNLPRLAFMKIDAEGMECKVLAGAAETIRRCKPVMFIEVNSGALLRAGDSADKLRTMLNGFGYRTDHWSNGPQFDVLCQPI